MPVPVNPDREDVDSGRLLDLSLAINDLLAVLVEGLDLDDLVPFAHGNVAQLDGELVSRKNHADKVGLERKASVGVALGGNDLDKLARSSAREETVRDGTGERGERREVGVDVDGVEITRDVRVRLVGGGSDKGGGNVRGAKRVARLERSDTTRRDTAVTLDVFDDGVTVADGISSVLDLANLDQSSL